MRHAVLFCVLSGAAVVAPVLAVAGTDAAPRGPAALTGAAAGGRVVEYRGLRIPVPAGWAVHRLAEEPARCVRYDRHAVYLGRPGAQPDCPARVVGRTEAVHVQPAGDVRTARTVVHGDKLAALIVKPSVDHETRLTLPEAGVTITGVYGSDPGRLQRVLRGTRLAAGRTAAPPEPAVRRMATTIPPAPDGEPASGEASGQAAPPDQTVPPDLAAPPDQSTPPDQGTVPDEALERPWVRGKGFDTCTAPSLVTMKAWRPSFKVTNIYIGGAARGCAQPNLSASWVKQVRKMGYRITPTYVGLQAPCGTRPQRFTAKNAASQGTKAAVDAARKAGALGIPAGKPIYFDMEAYNFKKAACKAAVLRFVDNWVDRLKKEGYEPCLYSSAKSGIRDVARSTGTSKPVAVWFANWDGRAKVDGDPFVPDGLWSPHRRIKQYRGGHKEKHGGVTLNIDSNIADGRVY
ncbi:DUF1906 domain-containing protein [Actinomadura darangshiensis]|uniref:DUF1906 domain-containing protein n=1 Tax=Actinomadura darangshiensis TaxID=705336 RepID=A0A4R5BAP8_9ACTN|nr:DUF1906 domain-containing protein [Actinomadura darangshiensis]TDD80804.1 DUF1906 domain-containing protein [Actinomadura darangshiensis]